jgi:hypothetical protein
MTREGFTADGGSAAPRIAAAPTAVVPRRFLVEVDSLLSLLVHRGGALKDHDGLTDEAARLYAEARSIYDAARKEARP